MNNILSYMFYPNPGDASYTAPAMLAVAGIAVGLLLLSLVIKLWRGRLHNSVTKKLTRSWSSLCFWFGIVALILLVCRVERIQFLAMRFMWVLWAAGLLLALFVQFRVFRMRHYEILPRATAPKDSRSKYLPGKKR